MIRNLTFLALLAGAWSLTQNELDAFTPRHPGYTDFNTGLKSVVWGKDSGGGTQTIYTNGIPSHPTWAFPQPSGNPNELKEIRTILNIYSEPRMRDEPLRCLPMGFIGIATSGVAIDGWFPAERGCPEVAEFEELDICEGHPSPNGQYHYHHYSPCVQMPTCGEPSSIWGVAIDGIPIYGPFDEDGRQLTKEDLDECGGKVDSTGRYKYHMTVDPPYSLGCLRGEIRSDVGKEARTFFCACPFDDTMFVDRSGGKSHGYDNRGSRPSSICQFSSDGNQPAQCEEVYNHDYDIGYEWVKRDKTIKLAPCCSPGKDCGDSCKTENGLQGNCTQEERTIKYTTRIAKDGFIPDDGKDDESGQDRGGKPDRRCMQSCMQRCEGSGGRRMGSRGGQMGSECEKECHMECTSGGGRPDGDRGGRPDEDRKNNGGRPDRRCMQPCMDSCEGGDDRRMSGRGGQGRNGCQDKCHMECTSGGGRPDEDRRQDGGRGRDEDRRQDGGRGRDEDRRQDGGRGRDEDRRQDGGRGRDEDRRQDGGRGRDEDRRQDGGRERDEDRRQDGGRGRDEDRRQDGGRGRDEDRRQDGGRGRDEDRRQDGGRGRDEDRRQDGGRMPNDRPDRDCMERCMQGCEGSSRGQGGRNYGCRDRCHSSCSQRGEDSRSGYSFGGRFADDVEDDSARSGKKKEKKGKGKKQNGKKDNKKSGRKNKNKKGRD